MRFFALAAASLTLFVAAPALAVPTNLKTVQRYDGVTTGKYIVQFKAGVARSAAASRMRLKTDAEWEVINGFAATLTEEQLNALRASDDVESIVEDGVMSIFATQTNAPWGLGRISQAARLTNQNVAATTFTFPYHDSAGEGVDIYIADTGVYTAHSQFGGRAIWGASFVGASTDGHGHGTHCAGTAAGSQYGVAKKASVIAVQVLNSSGSGSISGIVSGLDWVLTRARSTGRPSVVSMSLGGGANTALDNAVASLTSAGIHVVVAAGNSNVNAANTSPARAPSAITVAAATIADAKASYSNFGAIIDIWAPGTSVISSWIGGTTATNSISGTSMATPHVAGAVAYLIARDGNISPAAMATKLKNLSTKNALSGVPSGTVNELLRID